MKSYLVLLALLLHTHMLFSQFVWCPPEAEWYYDGKGQAGPFTYNLIRCVGDTVVEGKICQKLLKEWYYGLPNSTIIKEELGVSLTYVIDSTVYIVHETMFDTLYAFTAIPGDTWNLPCYEIYENNGLCDRDAVVTVLDTLTLLINNNSLKTLVLEYHFGDPFEPGINVVIRDTVIERIGTINHYLLPWDMLNEYFDVQEGGSFRCYSDNTIGQFKNTNKACDYVKTVGFKNSVTDLLSVFPNPFTDKLTLIIKNSKDFQLDIINLQGNSTIYRSNVLHENITLNTSEWPAGIYFILAKDRHSAYIQKVIKI